uniref:Uncharacterized protein n=1 Tax=Oryza sativa subsp. japonica TaxID=39947 RepID=Q6YVI1_ORYSJ|nr:hypothetical protein [Oryza sativa Japonica Group]
MTSSVSHHHGKKTIADKHFLLGFRHPKQFTSLLRIHDRNDASQSQITPELAKSMHLGYENLSHKDTGRAGSGERRGLIRAAAGCGISPPDLEELLGAAVDARKSKSPVISL